MIQGHLGPLVELLPFVYFHTWILFGANLQNYTRYGYEILWIDLIKGSAVPWTLTFTCLIYELLPFVYFHTWILSGAYLQNYTSYGYEILWVDRSHQGRVQCPWILTLASLKPFPNSRGFYVSAVSMSLEDTLGKGEIACEKQFLLSPQCFLPFWRTVCHFIKIVVCKLFQFGRV